MGHNETIESIVDGELRDGIVHGIAILAGTPDSKLGFDELLDAIDSQPELMKQLSDLILTPTAAERIVQLSNEGGPEPKKG